MQPFSPHSVNNLGLISEAGSKAQPLRTPEDFYHKTVRANARRLELTLINNTASMFTGLVRSRLIRCLHMHGNAVPDVSKNRFQVCKMLKMVFGIVGKHETSVKYGRGQAQSHSFMCD